jgi:Na+/proline symporter
MWSTMSIAASSSRMPPNIITSMSAVASPLPSCFSPASSRFGSEMRCRRFQILLQIGAGTGLIFLLRWYWWRINAWGEIAAMVISFLLAVYFHFGHARLGFTPLHPTLALVIGVLITTIGWLAVTLLTPPTDIRVAVLL